MNNFVRVGGVAFTILISACATSEMSTSLPGDPVPVVRLRSDPYSFTFVSGFDNPARLVVRDAATWQAIWAQTFKGGSVPTIPVVDFSREMLVVVALGSHSSGGYGILIDGASDVSSGNVSVTVRSISPGARCGVTGAFTQPVDIARMPRRDGTVSFVERTQVTDCR
jgi:hypothetical protein